VFEHLLGGFTRMQPNMTKRILVAGVIIVLSIYTDRQPDAAKSSFVVGMILMFGTIYYFKGFFTGAKWVNFSFGREKAIPCSRLSLLLLTLFFGIYATVSFAVGLHHHIQRLAHYSSPMFQIFVLLLILCHIRDRVLLKRERDSATNNKSPAPTAVGAGRSAVAVHAKSRRRLGI
jgi:hypothetical protein